MGKMRYKILLFALSAMVGLFASCQAKNILVDYQRTGGFAGLDDHLVIGVEGNATLTRKSQSFEFTLDDTTMDQLKTVFEEAGFSKLEREYLPERQGADFIEYIVTYQGDRVRTMDTAVPDSLWQVLEFLNQIVESGGKP
jgi:hypothetical protein